MAFRKQKQSFFITILLKTALMVVSVIATTNIDCKGKAFHCVNSTHFKICVDFGGVSKTVDDFLIPCPPSTVCTDNNYYECEYQMPTTPAALDVQSDVTNELSESPVSSPWELFDVSTLFPLNNNERSIELSENSTITPPDTVFEVAGTETADTHNYSLVNEVQNEVITENILYKTTVSDLSESDINNPTARDVISSTTVMVAINGMPDYLNTTIPYAAVNVNNYSTTESTISDDLFNTLKTTALDNVEDAGFIATTLFAPVMTYNLSTNGTSEKTTENYISTTSEIAIDLYEPPLTTLTNNIENEDFPSTITDNLSKNDTAEKATTEKYPSTKSEMAVDLNELAITTLTNNIRDENLPSKITETPSDTVEKEATTEKYTSTTREITIDFYEPVITTLKNYIENENLSSTITNNLSTSDTAEKATTEIYPNTKSEIVVDLNEHTLTTLTNNTENENLPSTIAETLSTRDTVEKEATTEKYRSTTREIAIDLYEPPATTLTNKIENEGLSSTITDNLIINRTPEKATTEKYPSTKSVMGVDLNDLAITTLTNNTKNENLPSTVTETLSTSDTVEKEAITEKYTSTTRDITIDFYEPVIATLKNIIENENLSSTVTDNLSTSYTAEKATTEKYPSTKSEMAVDLNEFAITTLTNNTENENLPSTITETLSASDTVEKEATTEKYTSTTREITIDFYEPVIATLKNNVENENLSSRITDNLSTSDTAEKATTEKYPSTKSEMAVDLNELAITTLTNNTENENLSTITETLSTSDKVEKEVTTEKYTSTTREIGIDLYEPPVATLTNKIENEDLSSTITDNLIINRKAEKATTEKYTSTKSEIAIDLYEAAITLTDNIENLPKTITNNLSTSETAFSEIKKNIANNETSEIDLTGTSDSYLVSTQDTTARDVNIPTETATHATISYTNTVKKSSIERADDNFMHANSTYMNKNDENSSYSKTVDSIQMESPSMITENAALEGYSTKEQKDFLSVTRPDSLKIENIFTSNTTDSTKSTGENISTVKDFNHLITQAIVYHKKDSNDKENIHSNIDYTTVYSPVITESNSNTENIINSSSDAIIFSTISDSYLVNVQEDRVKKDVNSSTTVNDGYRNAGMNSSQVDDSSMHETLISNVDLSFTPGYDKELQLTTNVNLILKDTTAATEQNDIYLQIRESGIKNEILATKSTISVIDSTSSYEANHSITYTVNEIEVQTNIAKKISNDTAEEILKHKKDIFRKEIDYKTSPLPPNADSVTASFFKNNSDEISLPTVNVGLNDQVEELLNKENNHSLSSVNNKSSLVTNLKNITKNLSLLPDLIVTTESYRADSQQNTTVINLQFSTSSLTDETKGYQLNNQNSKVTETLTYESFATIDEYGSKHYDNDGNTGNISEPVYTESIYKNVNSTQSDPGILKRLGLEHLVNNKDTNNIIKDGRRADVGLTISKNSLKVASNIEHLNNAAVSNDDSIPLNLSANIYKKINKTNDDSTWNSVKSGGLNIHDNRDNLVPFSNQHLQYTLNSTLEDSSKNPVSNTYSTYMLKNKTSLSNISENLENVLRNYQNNSNLKMISNKTRKDVIDINAWYINKNEQINFSANQDKRKDQNNRTTKITANVQLNSCNSSTDYERTMINNNCKNRQRGKYADKKDCQKFYICIGRSEPIFGKCPNNTVFSEISKQCTKNLSHCIRNNQFQCPSEGRYIDIFSDQFYFICAKNVEGYIRFKLKCQKGYHLDKSQVHCILDSLNGSMSHEDISETDREKSTIENKSKEETDSKNQKNNFELKCQKGYHLDKSKLQCILDALNESTSKEDISKTDREKSTTESKSKEDTDSKYQKSNFECKKEGVVSLIAPPRHWLGNAHEHLSHVYSHRRLA